MKTRVDDRLRREAAQFAFRFACDDCAHFEPSSARCSLSYPASPRRSALLGARTLERSESTGPSQPARTLELCKAFELE
jgi:hypothetical protein